MGMMHHCRSCHETGNHKVLQRTELGKEFESLVLECEHCGYTSTGVFAIDRHMDWNHILECPDCGSLDTTIDEGPWVYETYMKFNQTCYSCGKVWTGVYEIPQRIRVEDESNFLEDVVEDAPCNKVL